jgi:N-acetylglutamate synthase-like GNAT family acetyltransferase
LRGAVEDDWPAIRRVANEALPNAPDGNGGWFEARRSFDETRRQRRHYVAEGGGEVVAYSAIEETDDPERWRVFAVMEPLRLRDGLGERMLDQLLHDAHQLGASTLWMREQADDPLLSFVREHGFAETRRFVIRDGTAYDGVEVIELERPIEQP